MRVCSILRREAGRGERERAREKERERACLVREAESTRVLKN